MSRSDTLPLPPPAPRGAGVIDAQVAGQAGAKRGLREGAPALERARRAYLSAEWRGPDDRRPQAGLVTRVRL